MDSRRTRRLLIASFALSLLIHLIVASGMRRPFVHTPDDAEVVHVQHVRVTRIAHVPTPPPHTPPPQTPPPTATPAPARSAAPAPARAAHATTGMPVASGTGAAAATAAPTPVSTPAPAATQPCSKNDLPAAIAASPDPAEISAQARADAVSGTTRVRVMLDAAGAVQSATVTSSSGSNSLDLVAVSMARAAQYTPARHDCKAIASDYTYSVKFVSW